MEESGKCFSSLLQAQLIPVACRYLQPGSSQEARKSFLLFRALPYFRNTVACVEYLNFSETTLNWCLGRLLRGQPKQSCVHSAGGWRALWVSDLDRYILIDGGVCLPNCHRVYRGATQYQCWNCLSEHLATRAMGIGDRAVTLFFLCLMAPASDLPARSCLSGP